MFLFIEKDSSEHMTMKGSFSIMSFMSLERINKKELMDIYRTSNKTEVKQGVFPRTHGTPSL